MRQQAAKELKVTIVQKYKDEESLTPVLHPNSPGALSLHTGDT